MVLKTRHKVSAAVIGGSMIILVPWLCSDEGDKLKAYRDTANVWTVCSGIAYVDPKTVYTQEQCDTLNRSKDQQFTNATANLVDGSVIEAVNNPQLLLAADTHFAFNIGIKAFAGSRALELQNAGDVPGSCKAMMNWLKPPEILGRRTRECKACLESVGIKETFNTICVPPPKEKIK